MPNPIPRHRHYRLVSLHRRLMLQLEALMALDSAARKVPLTDALRGPGWRLIGEAARLVPLPEHLPRTPRYPWQLLASTLGALGSAKSLLEAGNSPPLDKTHKSYPRSPESAYDG
jgi:hypothetical protein